MQLTMVRERPSTFDLSAILLFVIVSLQGVELTVEYLYQIRGTGSSKPRKRACSSPAQNRKGLLKLSLHVLDRQGANQGHL